MIHFSQKRKQINENWCKRKGWKLWIDIDLPGYDKNDIKIELTDGYLTVTASRTEHKEEKRKTQ